MRFKLIRMSCNFDLHCIPPLKGVLVPPPWKFLSQTEQVSDCIDYTTSVQHFSEDHLEADFWSQFLKN